VSPEGDGSAVAVEPAFAGYFADPFVLRLDGGYAAYGTGESGAGRPRVFESLSSADLVEWEPVGAVLQVLPAELGDEYWAPEVAQWGGAYWMYYSVGHGISGHHLRVARAESPAGPFIDLGINLTPEERFAIDPHPFLDDDGLWYLYFARDVLESDRPGTHLAVAPLASMTQLTSAPIEVLAPSADWQVYERSRAMYGGVYDWHTLEGPSVVRRHGRYWMTFSGGAWTGAGYGVSWAVADSPLGPWLPAPMDSPRLLETTEGGLIGPGHNSLVVDPSGRDAIVYHAWNRDQTIRQMYVEGIDFTPSGPVIRR
jgi:GH43 family beta-xylosidase